jgi:hypothetical protein
MTPDPADPDTWTPPRILGRSLAGWVHDLTFHLGPDDRLTGWSRLLRWAAFGVCRRLTGHRWDPVESGYGGGEWTEVWCGYCGYQTSVPISEMPSRRWLVDLFNTLPPIPPEETPR